jgi:hypothetical protein
MSDRISRMADDKIGFNELLIEILESLKSHGQAVLELTGDVEGLKGALTGYERDVFLQAKATSLREVSAKFDREARLYDAMLQRLRGN